MSGLSYRVGAQREVTPGWFAGVTAAYSDSWLAANDGYTKSEGVGGDMAVSLKHQRGPWLFAVSTHLGYKSLDNRRVVDVGPDVAAIASASEVWTMGARFRASRQFVFTDWYLKPRIDLDILHTRMPAFAEKSDAPYSLQVAAMQEWTPMISPAVELGGRFDLGESTSVHPYLSLGASFMRNERLSAEAWFKTADADISRFRSSVKMPSSLLDIGLGAQLFSAGKYELRAEAKSRIGEDFLEQEGSLRFSVRF